MVNKRNPNLDLIKSVACVSVVGLHAVSMNNYTIYYLCDCGVPLFSWSMVICSFPGNRWIINMYFIKLLVFFFYGKGIPD